MTPMPDGLEVSPAQLRRERWLIALTVLAIFAVVAFMMARKRVGVRGRVTDADGMPVAGASVQLQPERLPWWTVPDKAAPARAITAGDGSFEFARLRHRRVHLTVRAKGFGRVSRCIDVGDDWRDVSFTLLPAAQLEVEVAARGEEQTAVHIAVAGAERDGHGKFAVDDLPAGHWLLTATSDDCAPLRTPVWLREGETAHCRVAMQPSSTLVVRLLDEVGEPAPDGGVALWDELQPGSRPRLPPADAGCFVFRDPPRHRFRLLLLDDCQGGAGELSDWQSPLAAGERRELVLRLHVGSASVTFRLPAKSRTGWWAAVSSDGVGRSATVDAGADSFTFANLRAGHYRLLLQPTSEMTLVHGVDFELEPGQHLELGTPPMLTATGSLRCRPTAGAAAPLLGVVSIVDADGQRAAPLLFTGGSPPPTAVLPVGDYVVIDEPRDPEAPRRTTAAFRIAAGEQTILEIGAHAMDLWLRRPGDAGGEVEVFDEHDTLVVATRLRAADGDGLLGPLPRPIGAGRHRVRLLDTTGATLVGEFVGDGSFWVDEVVELQPVK